MCRHATNFKEETCSWCIAEKKDQQTVCSESGCGSNGLGINGVNGFKKFRHEDSSVFYASIGFLATHADIVAMVIIKNEEDFKKRYTDLKGHEPVFCKLKNEDQWANELRVIVELPSWETNFGNIIPVKGSGNKKHLNSNDFVWWLLEKGFDLGKKHDVENIRTYVPEEFKEDFDLGTIVN